MAKKMKNKERRGIHSEVISFDTMNSTLVYSLLKNVRVKQGKKSKMHHPEK